MGDRWNRRRVLKQFITAAGLLMLAAKRALAKAFVASARTECEIQISSIGAHTLRLSVLPIKDGLVSAIPSDGSLVQDSWGEPVAILRGDWHPRMVNAGGVIVRVSSDPLTFTIQNAKSERVQQLTVDQESGVVHFETGDSTLFGLGEGGPQFDRRGSVDRMISGQGGYELKTHGGRRLREPKPSCRNG